MKKVPLSRILLMLTICSWQQLFAQMPNSVAFPSANNKFLGASASISSSSEVGVDLYTGTGQVSVPICNLSSIDLNIPISLSYTGARGIKVQEYATSSGLGWTLNAGGGISRVVRGWPDERPEGFLGIHQWGQQVANFVNNGAELPTQITGNLEANPSADGEPDIFYIRTPFFAVQFVFDEFGVPVFSNSTGIKVIANDFYSTSNYGNSNFKVIDENGTQYFFGSSAAAKEETSTSLYGQNYTFPTTWYLDKIVTANGKETINFSYTSRSQSDVYKHYQSIRTYGPNGCVRDDNTTVTSSVLQPKFISYISSPTGTMYFNYANDRRDVPNSPRLTSIELRSISNGFTERILQTYRFEHSYFGDPSSDPEALRLKLDKITVTGNTPVTKTPLDFRVFTYNTAENLPPHNSNLFDFWGYYTTFVALMGDDDPMQKPNLRQPDYNRAKANVLTAIKDVTGATWQLNYELNTFQTTSSGGKSGGGLRVSSIVRSLPTGESNTTTYTYQTPIGILYGQPLTDSYANLKYNDPSWGPYYWQVMSETPSNVYDLNGTFVGYSQVKTTQQNGSYTITEFNNFSDFPDIFTYHVVNNQSGAPNIVSSTSRAFKRGLPKSQTVYTSAGKKVSQDVYGYASLTNPVARKSWAFRWLIVGYNICNSYSFSNLCAFYSTFVENYRTSQVVHREFDQLDDNRYVEKTVNYTYADNKRLVRSMTTTDSKGQTQTKTSYYPEDVNTPGIPMLTSTEQTAMNDLIDKNCLSAVVHETQTKNGTTTQIHNGYTAFPIGMASKVYLTSLTNYKESVAEKVQQFNYNLDNSHLISTKDENGKSTSYFYDYNSQHPSAKIVNASAIVTIDQTPSEAYGGRVYGNGVAVNFTLPTAGSIRLQMSEGSESGTDFTRTANYYLYGAAEANGTLCASFPAWQCNSNGEEVTLSNMPAGTYTLSITTSTTLPGDVPSVAYYYTTFGAVYNFTNEFYFEDFEFTTSPANGGHTGTHSYNGNYSVYFTPPAGRACKIQWWENIGGVWKFNEADYTYGYTVPGGNIDDIRVFPADALMTSYVYEPMVGLRSETDPAGKSIFYEYDGYSRPNIVRDNEGRITKKNCYNYSGQTNGCALFTNTAQSGVFTRNNCSSGFGLTATYTVDAGRYYSEISQQDADQQALNDVNTNGQGYANSVAGCGTVFINNPKSGAFTRNNCPSGYGQTVIYTVDGGRYSSTISQQDADQQALNDVNTNGQGYANSVAGCGTIYARSYKEVTDYYHDDYYTYEYSDFYVRFYSDDMATNRLTLPNQLLVTVHFWYFYENSYSHDSPIEQIVSGTVDSGVDEYHITGEETINCITGPTWDDYDCRMINVWLEYSNNYTII